MELQQIVGFYHVVRLGSFTKAADVTFRTQSALSQQVKSLEQELGCRLLERIGRKKLRLTLAGEQLIQFAQTVMDKHDYLMGEINKINRNQTGRLRIAAPFNTLYYLLPKYIAKYKERFPNVDLTIVDRPPIGVVEMVRDGEVDFGLTMESAIPKDLVIQHWKKGDYILMTPEDHPLLKEKQVTLEQIAQYPLILPPRYVKSSVRLKLLRMFEKQGIKHRISMESSNAYLSIRYIEMGLGISFFLAAKELKTRKPKKLKIIPLKHYFKSEYISLTMRKDKLLTSVSSAFRDMIFDKQ